MTLDAQQLCEVFRDRAAAVHELVTFSYSNGLGVSEESITDMLLVEIRRKLPHHVMTRKFTKYEESSVSGADWLWVIGRPGRWLPILVQAKLARPGEANLKHLHYKKGAQRQTLVQYARREGCIPLYVIYSGFTGKLPPASKQKRFKPERWTPSCPIAAQREQMGCVVVRPRQVALMHRGKAPRESVMRLMNAGKPWACLFCCPHAIGPIDLAASALAGLRQLPMDNPEARSPGGEDSNIPDDIYELGEGLIVEQEDRLPEAVRAVLEGRAPDKPPPFSAVTVISSEPLDLPVRKRRR